MIESTGEDRNRRPSRRGEHLLEFLMMCAAGARVFRSPENRYYARVSIGDRHEIRRLDSPAFRDWLIEGFRDDQLERPSESMIRKVVNFLELTARRNRASAPVFLRVGGDGEDAGSTYFLDLGDASGRAVRDPCGRLVSGRSTGDTISSPRWALAAPRAEQERFD